MRQYVDGLVQDCSALAMVLLQSLAKSSMYEFYNVTRFSTEWNVYLLNDVGKLNKV